MGVTLTSPPGLPDETRLGYNANDDLVEIRKVVNGKAYIRKITDPDVTDTTVSKWVIYSAWNAE